MADRIVIKYHKPQASSVSMYDLDHDADITTKVTTVVQTKLRKSKRNIPIQPRIHSKALLNLAILSNETRSSSLITVGCYMALLLCKDSPTIVEIQQGEIASQLKLSIPSIIKAMHRLEELKYIKNIGKCVYKISPRLAFYGSNIPWSLALQYEAEGKSQEACDTMCEVINKQIADTLEIIVEPLEKLTREI